MNTKNIKAVIFDMDGTLIDTEKYYRMFWPKALAHFGYEMTDEQALTMRSLGQPYAPQHLKEMFRDPDLDYTAIRNYRKQIMGECLKKNGIEIKKGAIELLDYLKAQGIHRAIATATDQLRTEQYLKQRISISMHADSLRFCRRNVSQLRIPQTVYAVLMVQAVML